MIPKIIHYCWFGENEINEKIKCYTKTWEEFCPDYQVIRWGEKNSPLENNYCMEAFERKKWAFVSDYVRLKVLYDYGGFYLDTDVQLVNSLDGLLNFSAVIGLENRDKLSTAVIGVEKNNPWIKLLLDSYENDSFIDENGNENLKTNVERITNITLSQYNCSITGEVQEFAKNMFILPVDYLCAKSYLTGKLLVSDNTYAIHHFSGTWIEERQKNKLELYRKMYDEIYFIPESVKDLVIKCIITAKFDGIKALMRKIVDYLK